MKYKETILIEKISTEKFNDKLWVVVDFNNGTRWVPALIEQAIIAQKVSFCEKSKYINLGHAAHLLPMEFLKRAIEGENICMLAFDEKFKLTHTRAFKKFCLKKTPSERNFSSPIPPSKFRAYQGEVQHEEQ